ncbi:MAG: hypothetical protein K8L91_09385 [Anaerolineae bacterium]|nr:hypothetical protein [Anaerolineae bacterium]
MTTQQSLIRWCLLIVVAITLWMTPTPHSVTALAPLPNAYLWQGLDYGPYRDGQAPGATPPTLGQIQTDMAQLAQKTSIIRIYGVIHRSGPSTTYPTGEWIVQSAAAQGLQVVIQAWIDGNATYNNAEVAEVIRLVNLYPNIVGVVVGSEVLLRYYDGDPNNGGLPIAQLTTLLQTMRSGLPQVGSDPRVPITYADNYPIWTQYGSQLIGLVDFIGLHSYAFWACQPFAQAVTFTINEALALRNNATLQGKRVMILETGWPSAGANPNCPAQTPGSATNQAQFVQYMLTAAHNNQLDLFIFEFSDENWKCNYTGTFECRWGLVGADRTTKSAWAEWRTDTLSLYNPANGQLCYLTSLSSPPNAPTCGIISPPAPGQFVMGDWNADGLKTPGIYGSNGVFYYANTLFPTSWSGIWIGLLGRPAVVGRFDSNFPNDCAGAVDSGNFPPYGLAFAIYFSCDLTNGTAPPLTFQWLSVLLPDSQGFSGTHQFAAGDFNLDSVETIAVRRGAFIAWTNVVPTTLLSQFSLAQYIGAPGSGDAGTFVAGDWDNNWDDSFGLYYQNGTFYRRNDVEWNTGLYTLQAISPPAATGIQVASWRNTPTSGISGEIAGNTSVAAIWIEAEAASVQQSGQWVSQQATHASAGGYLYSTDSGGNELQIEFEGIGITVYYLAFPQAGMFTILIDDTAVRTVVANGDLSEGVHSIRIDYLAPGSHTLQIQPISGTVAIDAFEITP